VKYIKRLGLWAALCSLPVCVIAKESIALVQFIDPINIKKPEEAPYLVEWKGYQLSTGEVVPALEDGFFILTHETWVPEGSMTKKMKIDTIYKDDDQFYYQEVTEVAPDRTTPKRTISYRVKLSCNKRQFIEFNPKITPKQDDVFYIDEDKEIKAPDLPSEILIYESLCKKGLSTGVEEIVKNHEKIILNLSNPSSFHSMWVQSPKKSYILQNSPLFNWYIVQNGLEKFNFQRDVESQGWPDGWEKGTN
jgi:hypothetical protein